jgi:hypothetical protein
MNRSIWLDVLTLVLIVVVGVAAGYLLLHVFMPEGFGGRRADRSEVVVQDIYE